MISWCLTWHLYIDNEITVSNYTGGSVEGVVEIRGTVVSADQIEYFEHTAYDTQFNQEHHAEMVDFLQNGGFKNLAVNA